MFSPLGLCITPSTQKSARFTDKRAARENISPYLLSLSLSLAPSLMPNVSRWLTSNNPPGRGARLLRSEFVFRFVHLRRSASLRAASSMAQQNRSGSVERA